MKSLQVKISTDADKKIMYITNETRRFEDVLLLDNFDDKEDFKNRISEILDELYEMIMEEPK